MNDDEARDAVKMPKDDDSLRRRHAMTPKDTWHSHYSDSASADAVEPWERRPTVPTGKDAFVTFDPNCLVVNDDDDVVGVGVVDTCGCYCWVDQRRRAVDDEPPPPPQPLRRRLDLKRHGRNRFVVVAVVPHNWRPPSRKPKTIDGVVVRVAREHCDS